MTIKTYEAATYFLPHVHMHVTPTAVVEQNQLGIFFNLRVTLSKYGMLGWIC